MGPSSRWTVFSHMCGSASLVAGIGIMCRVCMFVVRACIFRARRGQAQAQHPEDKKKDNTHVAVQYVPHAVCAAALTMEMWESNHFLAEAPPVFPTSRSPFWCANCMPARRYLCAISSLPWRPAVRLRSCVAATVVMAVSNWGLPFFSSMYSLSASAKKTWLRAAMSWLNAVHPCCAS